MAHSPWGWRTMYKKLLMLAVLLSVSPVWAATSYYAGASSETQFGLDAASRGVSLSSLLDFTGGTPAGVSFSVSTGSLDITGGTASYFAGSSGDSLQIDLASNVYAIGLYVTKSLALPSSWNYPGGSFSIPSGQPIFFGVMSDTPLASLLTILLTAQSSAPLTIQNFVLGTAAITEIGEAPEPSSMVLLGASLLGLASMARRKKRQGDRRPESER